MQFKTTSLSYLSEKPIYLFEFYIDSRKVCLCPFVQWCVKNIRRKWNSGGMLAMPAPSQLLRQGSKSE